MMTDHIILSSFSSEELTNQITEAVFNKFAPLIQSVNKPQPETEFLTRKAAAKLLGVSLPTILHWTKTGKIKGYRIASRVRFKRHELETSLSQIKTRR